MSENQMDMLKMMEQVMALKSMMGSSEIEKDNTKNNSMDMEQMMKMMQMFSNNKEENVKSSSEKENFFDEPIYTSELKCLKAAVPYLEYPQQKNMAIFIKIMELKKLKEMYDNNDASILLKKEDDEDCTKMLSAVRPHMEADKKHVVDTYIKLLEINKMMKKINQDESENYI